MSVVELRRREREMSEVSWTTRYQMMTNVTSYSGDDIEVVVDTPEMEWRCEGNGGIRRGLRHKYHYSRLI